MSVKPLERAPNKVRSLEEWRSVIDQYERSGLSQKQFCTREGIRFGSFKAWLYRLKALDQQDGGESSPLFTPIGVSPEVSVPQESSPLILEVCGEMRIIVRSGFESETLSRLLNVVRYV